MDFEIDDVAWTTQRWHTGPITGIIFNFHGLGAPALRVEMEWHEWEWTRAGAIVVFPYYGPWSWMNRSARAFCHVLVEKVYQKFELHHQVPLIMTGASMGGLSALLYTRYAKRPVTACAVSAPACDLKHHFTERPDVKRTVLCAFQGYPEPPEPLFAEHSPLAQVPHMPDIPYFIYQGDADKALDLKFHSERMVPAMRQRGLNVEYVVAPGVGHEEPPQYREMRIEWVKKFLKQK